MILATAASTTKAQTTQARSPAWSVWQDAHRRDDIAVRYVVPQANNNVNVRNGTEMTLDHRRGSANL